MKCWVAILSLFTSINALAVNVVTDYGAVGDAIKMYVATVSGSATIVPTNAFTSGDIGKAIEVFGAGTVTSTPQCQDLVATITNVVGGNAIVNALAGRTLAATFCTYGHNNRTNFQNAINAASGDEYTITIPNGNYLSLSVAGAMYASLVVQRGGIHFIGESKASTVLLGQGAWTLVGGLAKRGFLFHIYGPVTNNFPSSFENLTLDGGVPNGYTSDHTFPASPVTGEGWDEVHSAVLTWGAGGSDLTLTRQTWTNLLFTHWRGEMVKTIDQATNGNILMTNCAFTDGNATAINIYSALDVSSCIFSNLFQIGEYYQQYSTNASYIRNSIFTNITGNGFVVNGGRGANPWFHITSNQFFMDNSGVSAIITTPADNLTITSNRFVSTVDNFAIALGSAGSQGTFCTSNVWINWNYVSAAGYFLIMGGNANFNDTVRNVGVTNNTAVSLVHNFASGTGWNTNMWFSKNTGNLIQSAGLIGQYFLDAGDNTWSGYPQNGGPILPLDYGGSTYYTMAFPDNGATYYFNEVASWQLPWGATMRVKNTNGDSRTPTLYFNSALTGTHFDVAVGQTVTAFWNGTSWGTNLNSIIQGNLNISGNLVLGQ